MIHVSTRNARTTTLAPWPVTNEAGSVYMQTTAIYSLTGFMQLSYKLPIQDGSSFTSRELSKLPLLSVVKWSIKSEYPPQSYIIHHCAVG